nr:hypothetical protein [Janthinobacterium sp. Marseille]
MKIEYKVRKVTKFIVTRFEENDSGTAGSSTQHGEFDNEEIAMAVGGALAKADQDRLNIPQGDTRIMFPSPSGMLGNH